MMRKLVPVSLLAWFALFIPAFGQGGQLITFEEAKQRADKGDAFAQAVAALHYQLGWNTEKNPELAARYATASANAGHPLGKFRLGALLRAGEGVSKDEQKGLALQAASFSALYNAQDPYSITSAAIMIFQGKVAGRNVAENERRRDAVALYKKAADMGYTPAQFNYAMALNEGHGVLKDAAGCQRYLSEALTNNYPPAQKFALEGLDLDRLRLTGSAEENATIVSGDGWSYEFVNLEKTATRLTSEEVDGKKVLLSNGQWIVTCAFSHLGMGRGRTLVTFYDSRSMLAVACVSVPNAVIHVDWSPIRKQFVILTSKVMPAVKFPFDVAQALVLIDLDKRQLARLKLWKDKGTDSDWNYDTSCWVSWKDNNIEVYSAKDSALVPYRPYVSNNSVFQNVSVKYTSRPYERRFDWQQSGTEYRQDASTGIDRLSLEHAGIFNAFGSKTDDATQRQTSVGGVLSVSDAGVNVLRTSRDGSLLRLNLTSLKACRTRLSAAPISDIGIFSDGTLRCVAGGKLLLYRDGKLQNPTVEPLEVFKAPKTSTFRWETCKTPVSYGEESLSFVVEPQSIYSGIVHICSIDTSGTRTISKIHITPPPKTESLMACSVDMINHSVGILSGDAIDGVFREFALASGSRVSSPIENILQDRSEFMRFPGLSPPGWTVETRKEGHTSDGIVFSVRAVNKSSGREYLVAEGAWGDISQAPVLNVSDDDKVSVLTKGTCMAAVRALDIAAGKTTVEAEWTWQSADGNALYEPSSSWLFVPTGSGFSIFKPFSQSPTNKIADLLVGDAERFAIVLPDGRYAGSPDCESLLEFQVGNGKVNGSSIAPWRNRPAAVLKALGADAEQIEVLAKVTERWQKRIGFDLAKPEPKASDLPKVSVPELPPLWAAGDSAGFTIEWQKGASPLKEIIVRVNGVESARFGGDMLPTATGDKGSVDATVKLAEGQNWIEVTAEDADGRRSDLQRFRTILKDSTAKTKRYIVALGVSEYAIPELNLQFAAKDAKDLLEALAGKGAADTGMLAKMFGQSGDAQGSDHVLLLTNDQVNRAAVEKIREFFGTSSESDEVILFCAGHGVLDDKLDYYYAGHDFDPERPAETGIKLDDLVGAVSSSKALKRLMLLDTCHAGVVGEKDETLLAQMDATLPSGVRAVAQRGMKVQQVTDFSTSDKQRFIEEMFSLPGTIRGVNIIGASAGAQFALESDKWNNGVFTASVIEGLRDKKADWNKDGRITVSELKNYLGQRVSELTAGAQKPSVVAFEQDQDFDLLN
jgi:TPR repeat protein/uncharacterized caspase-like protein